MHMRGLARLRNDVEQVKNFVWLMLLEPISRTKTPRAVLHLQNLNRISTWKRSREINGRG